jgi:LysM repeat protein
LRAGIAIVVPQKTEKTAKLVAKLDPKATGKGAVLGPGADATIATSPDEGDKDGAGVSASSGDDDEILVAVPDRVFNYEGRDRVFYRTRDGDTLNDIAEAVGVRPDDLLDWNNLDPTAKLHPKMVLQIYVRKDFDPTQIVLLDSARVRVVTLGSEEFLDLEAARRGKRRLVIEAKAGETLARMGRRYGLTVGDLARINRFSYNTELQPGQKVVVYSPVGASPRELAQGLAPDLRRDRGGTTLTRAGAAKIDTKIETKNGIKIGTKTGTKTGTKIGAKTADRTDRATERSGGPPGVRAVAPPLVKSGERMPGRDHALPSPILGKPAPARATVANARGDRIGEGDADKASARAQGKGPSSKAAPKKK